MAKQALGVYALGVGARSEAGMPPAAGDWWDPDDEGLCIWAAYQPMGAANLAASYVDLSGNLHDCAPGVAPTWNAVDGWIFNGTTQYLTTTFAAQNDQTQTMIVQFTDYTGGNVAKVIAGLYWQADANFRLMPCNGANQHKYDNGAAVAVAGITTTGNMGVAGNQGYLNGAADGGAIGWWAMTTHQVVFIGCQNLINGVPDAFCPCYIQAFALYDCTLTAPQVLAVATAMAAL